MELKQINQQQQVFPLQLSFLLVITINSIICILIYYLIKHLNSNEI